MRDLIESIARSIVTDEASLYVFERTERYQTNITVQAAGSDVGKLLGKRSKTITAIRNLVDKMCEGTDDHYIIWVEEVATHQMCAIAK